MNTDTDNTIIHQIEFELLALALPSSLGLVILRQTFVRVCPCRRVEYEQWDLFSPKF